MAKMQAVTIATPVNGDVIQLKAEKDHITIDR